MAGSVKSYLSKSALEAAPANELTGGDIAQMVAYHSGWETIGDGQPRGGNQFLVHSVTGPSDRPTADGGSVLWLNDPGNDTLFLQALFPGGRVYAEQFGVEAMPFGSTATVVNHVSSPNETASPIVNALNFVDNVLHFSGGEFVFDDELVIDKVGTTLAGGGAGSHDSNSNPEPVTAISSNNRNKAVIRVQQEEVLLTDFMVDSYGTRFLTASEKIEANRIVTQDDYNCGIRVEAVIPSTAQPAMASVTGVRIENVQVRNQPNDGVAVIGKCWRGHLKYVNSQDNNGHGFLFSNGLYTDRQKTASGTTRIFLDAPGVYNIDRCRGRGNEGHGFRIGSASLYEVTDFGGTPTEIMDGGIQIGLSNAQSSKNGNNKAYLESTSGLGTTIEASSFLHCDGLTINLGGFSGNTSDDDNELAGLAVMGRGGTLISPRLIKTEIPMQILRRTSGTDSQGWCILNPNIRGVSSGADYICFVSSGVENVQIFAGDALEGLSPMGPSGREVVGLDAFNGVDNDRVLNEDVEFTGDSVHFSNDSVAFSVSTGSDVVFTGGGDVTIETDLFDGDGLQLSTVTKVNNLTVPQGGTAVEFSDVPGPGVKWSIEARDTTNDAKSSFSALVNGRVTGTTLPDAVIANMWNQENASGEYSLTVIEKADPAPDRLAVELVPGLANDRVLDIFISEVVVE